jgi:hypothetical protein
LVMLFRLMLSVLSMMAVVVVVNFDK